MFSGKYLHGLTNVLQTKENTFIYLSSNKLYIYYNDNNSVTKKYLSELEYINIKSIYIEDKSTIQTRVGLKRLLVTGIFAFAMKKKEKN